MPPVGQAASGPARNLATPNRGRAGRERTGLAPRCTHARPAPAAGRAAQPVLRHRGPHPRIHLRPAPPAWHLAGYARRHGPHGPQADVRHGPGRRTQHAHDRRPRPDHRVRRPRRPGPSQSPGGRHARRAVRAGKGSARRRAGRKQRAANVTSGSGSSTMGSGSPGTPSRYSGADQPQRNAAILRAAQSANGRGARPRTRWTSGLTRNSAGLGEPRMSRVSSASAAGMLWAMAALASSRVRS